MYFEGAKKQACNYSENAMCYRWFSRNLAKIYRPAVLMNFFRCMRRKSHWSTHPGVFFNPSVPVVKKGHIIKQTWKLKVCLRLSWLLPPDVNPNLGSSLIIRFMEGRRGRLETEIFGCWSKLNLPNLSNSLKKWKNGIFKCGPVGCTSQFFCQFTQRLRTAIFEY